MMLSLVAVQDIEVVPLTELRLFYLIGAELTAKWRILSERTDGATT